MSTPPLPTALPLPHGDDRPLLYYWLGARRLKNREAADRIGVHAQSLYRYMLPFGDANRQVPTPSALERIVALTGGEIGAAHFYPPHLRGQVRTGKDDMADHVDAVSAHAAEAVS